MEKIKPNIDLGNTHEREKYPLETDIYVPTLGGDDPADKDYKKGYMYRYFYKQLNNLNGKVREINEKEHKKIKAHHLYKLLKIKWKIIGDKERAAELNTRISINAEKIMSGIAAVIKGNPIRYWKDIPDKITEFDVTNKLPRVLIAKKKEYSIDLIAEVSFDEKGQIFLLTEDGDIIYTEDAVGILVQL